MAHLIDKDASIAEIERRIASLESIGSENYLHDNYPKQYAMLVTLKSLKFSIDKLEVKEVDLEKSISNWLFNEGLPNDEELIGYIKETAEHFFELGIQASNKAQKGK